MTDLHEELGDALRRCGSSWGGAQAHGLLCGRLAVRGGDGVADWRGQLVGAVDPANANHAACDELLDRLFRSTWQQLSERQSEFELLLPDDTAAASARTQALAEWCEGFLHGLVSEKSNEALRKKLGSEPLSEIVRDLLEITRATTGDEDPHTTESAYSEIVEYVRVAVQLTYEELADTRRSPTILHNAGGDPSTVH